MYILYVVIEMSGRVSEIIRPGMKTKMIKESFKNNKRRNSKERNSKERNSKERNSKRSNIKKQQKEK
jgi:hypothetical protein